MKYYTGIGSRKTPQGTLNQMEMLASVLYQKHEYILRSGGAPGADSAFERGATLKEIYLPWDGFEDKTGNKEEGCLVPEDLNNWKDAGEIAEKFHPIWHDLSDGAKKLHTRNVYQILGKTLDNPSEFVICWTSDGKDSGGTGQAIRIAKHYEVPVYNLFNIKDQLKVQTIMLNGE